MMVTFSANLVANTQYEATTDRLIDHLFPARRQANEIARLALAIDDTGAWYVLSTILVSRRNSSKPTRRMYRHYALLCPRLQQWPIQRSSVPRSLILRTISSETVAIMIVNNPL